MAQSSHLNIPSSRIARSSSRESFATDISLLSLSSFTSEMPSTRHTSEQQSTSTFADRDDLELDFDKDNELARYREDMLEKMLESHSLAMPKSEHVSFINMSIFRVDNIDFRFSETSTKTFQCKICVEIRSSFERYNDIQFVFNTVSRRFIEEMRGK